MKKESKMLDILQSVIENNKEQLEQEDNYEMLIEILNDDKDFIKYHTLEDAIQDYVEDENLQNLLLKTLYSSWIGQLEIDLLWAREKAVDYILNNRKVLENDFVIEDLYNMINPINKSSNRFLTQEELKNIEEYLRNGANIKNIGDIKQVFIILDIDNTKKNLIKKIGYDLGMLNKGE